MKRSACGLILGLVCSTPVAAQTAATAPATCDTTRPGAAPLRALDAAVRPDGFTPLHCAVQRDDIALIDRLLAAKANPRAATRYNVTPLYLAALNGSAAAIERLLNAGADA